MKNPTIIAKLRRQSLSTELFDGVASTYPDEVMEYVLDHIQHVKGYHGHESRLLNTLFHFDQGNNSTHLFQFYDSDYDVKLVFIYCLGERSMLSQSKNTNQTTQRPQPQATTSFFAAGASLGLMLFPSLGTRREQEYLDQVNRNLERQHQEFLQRRQEIDNFLNNAEQPTVNNINATVKPI